jgi:predicted DCC family thiol-disulfide oxidoreductase YuxK
MSEGRGIILYDSVCILCSRSAQFVIARDHEAFFRFVPIQGDRGRELAATVGIDADRPQSFAVFIDGRPYLKSDGVIAILSRLPRWGWTSALRFIPRLLRDWIYDRVARNRYRIFGRADACIMPDASVRSRFDGLESVRDTTIR